MALANDAYVLLAVFLLTYILIVRKNFDKTLAAAVGGVLSVLVGIFISEEKYGMEEVLHYHDFEILAIVIGILIIVEISTKSGLFHYLSIKVLKLSKGDPAKLLLYFGLLTVILSGVLNNIACMLIVGSLTFLACDRLDLDPKPFILSEMFLTAVGGNLTVVSSVPNVIVAAQFGIKFHEFLIIALPISALLTLVSFAVYRLIFKFPPASEEERQERLEKVAEFDEWGAVEDKAFFNKSAFVLAMTMTLFVLAEPLGMSLAFVAVLGAVTMVFISGEKMEEALKIDWALIAFFAGLFVLIAGLSHAGVLDEFAEILGENLPKDQLASTLIILWVMAIMSGIVDNIVLAAALSPVLVSVSETKGWNNNAVAWALVLGANLGGGLTPIGAPANVIAISNLEKRSKEKIGWGDFLRFSILIIGVQLMIATIYIGILSTMVFT
ncbi:MAG: SLC13 family permease [Candidatus Hodarchaeales archaeon]|jgi:Na+/H+ antiporter NhaD/arsenite permease-like protein